MKWLALILFPTAALADPAIRTQNPQEYGWRLGDDLVQRVHVSLPEGVSVDPASLPKPRAVDYWLDLRAMDSERTDDGLMLTLRWQNFYAAIEPDRRTVPPSPIRLTNGTALQLPGFVFVTSPLRPIAERSSPDTMRPDPVFYLIDSGPNRLRFALSFGLFLVFLVAIAWHRAWWPFRARPARPFTCAVRQISRTAAPAGQRRCLHRAFDHAFGRALIAPDLPRFLDARPEYMPLADRLAGFFAASDQAFFQAGATTENNVLGLARDLSRIERS